MELYIQKEIPKKATLREGYVDIFFETMTKLKNVLTEIKFGSQSTKPLDTYGAVLLI